MAAEIVEAIEEVAAGVVAVETLPLLEAAETFKAEAAVATAVHLAVAAAFVAIVVEAGHQDEDKALKCPSGAVVEVEAEEDLLAVDQVVSTCEFASSASCCI